MHMSSPVIDEVDARILEVLQEDGRISYAELARLVGMSSPAVTERVKRLEALGVITGYRATVDLKKVGLPIMAIIRFAARGVECERVADFCRHMPEILESYRVAGGDSFVMKVAVPSLADLEKVIGQLTVHGETVTAIVMSVPVDHRTISFDRGRRGGERAAQVR